MSGEIPPQLPDPPHFPNPAFGIWWHPRLTIRKVLADEPERHVFWLLLMAGIGQSLDRASGQGMGDKLPLWAILLFCCTISPLIWVGFYWILSHLICWTGDWLGGRGNPMQIRAALAWSGVPVILTLPLWFALMGFTGSDIFKKDSELFADDADLVPMLAALAAVFGMVGLRVWALILTCQAIAEVHGYGSGWRALGNLILASLVLVLPLVAFAVLLILLLKS